MTSTVIQNIPVKAITPSCFYYKIRPGEIEFKDIYAEQIYKYGIFRDEMILLMGFLMQPDPLTGMDILRYVDETPQQYEKILELISESS